MQGDKSYVSNLAQSLSLSLEEFYSHLKTVGVSAMTGKGIDDFIKAIHEAADEYEKEYRVSEYSFRTSTKLRMKKNRLCALRSSMSG